MKKTIAFLIFLTLIVFLFNTIEIGAQAKKKYLLEEYTGAWCGWCPRGDYAVKFIKSTLGDLVIPVALHTFDKMETAEAVELASAYSVAFPTGVFDRKFIPPYSQYGFGVLPEFWRMVIDELLIFDTTAFCDVNVYWAFDEATRIISTSIEAIFYEDVIGDIRLNAYIVEDSCSGKGTGWDQANYLKKDERFKDYPYYSMPNPIPNFQHREVVRAMLAGPWGLEGALPQKIKAGEKHYAHLSYKIPNDWNIDRIKLVGIVQQYDDDIYGRTVLNCNYGKRVPPTTQLNVTKEFITVRRLGEPFSTNANIKNVSDKQINYSQKIAFSNRTPLGWYSSFEAENSDFTAEPNEELKCYFRFTPTAEIGIGDAICMIFNKDNPLEPGHSFKSSIYSEEIERFQVIDDEAGGKYSLDSLLNLYWNFPHFNISSENFTKLYQSFPYLKTIVWSSGRTGQISINDSDILKSIIHNGTRLFINGLMTGFVNLGTLYNYIKIIPRMKEGTLTTDKNKYIDGYEGDPISSEIKSQLVLNTFTTYLNTDQVNSFPILKISGTDTVIGARFQSGNKKAVLMAICPNDIVNENARNLLIKNTIDWLENNTDITDKKDSLFISAYYSYTQNKIIVNYYNSGQQQKILAFDFYDINGRHIFTKKQDFLYFGNNSIEIEAEPFASGLYYIKVTYNRKIIFYPLLIVK